MPPNVAILVKGYPRLSETFIAQEILALERLGLPLEIVSLRHPTDGRVHPLHEAIPLARQWLTPREFARWKRDLIAELARLSFELHRRCAFHRDLYLCHFYIPDEDTRQVPEACTGRVWMIDFHRLTFRGRWRRRDSQVKDLAQLLYSTFGVPGVTALDRARFWKLYRDHWEPGGGPARWVKTAAVLKANRYACHNARRAGVAR